MSSQFVMFPIILVTGFLVPFAVKAAPPERLFDILWSSDCAEKVQIETSEYTSFDANNWCDHFVDDYRVQSNCRKAAFKPLKSNRVGMTVEDDDRYIIEFLWSAHISIMRVVDEKPLKLEQAGSMGRAIHRKGLKTHHLYCP